MSDYKETMTKMVDDFRGSVYEQAVEDTMVNLVKFGILDADFALHYLNEYYGGRIGIPTEEDKKNICN